MPPELASLQVTFQDLKQFREVWAQLRMLSGGSGTDAHAGRAGCAPVICLATDSSQRPAAWSERAPPMPARCRTPSAVALEFLHNTSGRVGRADFGWTVQHVLGVKLRPQLVGFGATCGGGLRWSLPAQFDASFGALLPGNRTSAYGLPSPHAGSGGHILLTVLEPSFPICRWTCCSTSLGIRQTS